MLQTYQRILLLSILPLSLTMCGGGMDAGTGKKIGRVVEIGRHGVFCPTIEAKLVRGGFSNGDGANGSTMNFTVQGQELEGQLRLAMETQAEVEVTYNLRSFRGPCSGDSDVLAVSARVLPKQ